MANEAIKKIREAELSAAEKKEDAAKKSAQIVFNAEQAGENLLKDAIREASEFRLQMEQEAKDIRQKREEQAKTELEAYLTDLRVKSAVSMPAAVNAVMDALLKK
jgi:vacuolar-type H+-ATPase subunit H